MTERPAIPAELRRAILVEAGHRCAIPRCGQTEIEVHHIGLWAERKEHTYGNLIALCRNCHARAHRGEIDAKSLRLYKAHLLISSGRFNRFELDLMSDLAGMQGHPRQLSLEMIPLIRSAVEAGFLGWYGQHSFDGPTRYFVRITPEGWVRRRRRFVR